MHDKLPVTPSEQAIFDDTFTALSELDERYRLDSKLYVDQKEWHEAELRRIKENAATRHEELTSRRKKLAVGALELYAKYPEISDDHARVFALAEQLMHGQRAETHDLNTSIQGLLALDEAVASDKPILRAVNGSFGSLIVPDAEASGLSPVISDKYRLDEVSAMLYLPIRQEVSFPDKAQFPSIWSDRRRNILDEFSPYDENEQRPRNYRYNYPASAAVASSYDIKYRFEKEPKNDKGSEQVLYIIGENLIQEAIANKSNPQGTHGTDTEFAFQAWLAGKVAGYNFECNLSNIGKPIISRMSKIIYNCARGYDREGTELIDSKVARILLEAVHKLGAEDWLFKQFVSQLAEYYDTNAVFRDPAVARKIFDATIKMSNKSSD